MVRSGWVNRSLRETRYSCCCTSCYLPWDIRPLPLIFQSPLFCPCGELRGSLLAGWLDGWVASTMRVSHVSVRQRMLHSCMSLWYLILALRSSSVFSGDWTLASRILDNGGWCTQVFSLQSGWTTVQCFVLHVQNITLLKEDSLQPKSMKDHSKI